VLEPDSGKADRVDEEADVLGHDVATDRPGGLCPPKELIQSGDQLG